MGAGRHGAPSLPALRLRRAPPLGKTGPVNGVLTSLALVMLFVLIGGYFSGSELRCAHAARQPGRPAARTPRRPRAQAARRLQPLPRLRAGRASPSPGSSPPRTAGRRCRSRSAALLARWGVPAGATETVAFVAVTAFISYLSLVLRRAGAQAARAAAGRGGRAVRLPRARRSSPRSCARSSGCCRCRPTSSCGCSAWTRGPGASEVTEEELRDMVSTHGELGAEERRVLTTCSAPRTAQLNGVMVPRTEVEFLTAATLLADAARRRARQAALALPGDRRDRGRHRRRGARARPVHRRAAADQRRRAPSATSPAPSRCCPAASRCSRR